jgi:hypothetical protein
VLEAQIGPDEIRPLLEAGRVEPVLRALLWERDHGRRKRIAVIADQMARALWQTQVTLATTVPFEQMPVIGEDTLFILVDQALAAEGLMDGARLDEARAAIVLLLDTGALRHEGVGFVACRLPATSATSRQNGSSGSLPK